MDGYKALCTRVGNSKRCRKMCLGPWAVNPQPRVIRNEQGCRVGANQRPGQGGWNEDEDEGKGRRKGLVTWRLCPTAADLPQAGEHDALLTC